MKIRLMGYSDKVALIGLDFAFTYSQLYARAQKAHAGFAENSKKIAIFAENSPMWVFALYGAWLSGATVIPVDAKSTVDEVAFIVGDSDSETLCVSRDNLATAEAAISKLSNPPKILILEEILEGEVKEETSKDWKIERAGEELAFIVYTSGTTGNPKGVMLTFANLYANMIAVAEAKYYYNSIRVLALLPFHHILPLMGTLVMPLSIEGKMVFPRSISPIDIAEVLQKFPVDMIISVPRFYEMLHTNIMAKINESKIAKLLFKISQTINSITFSRKLFAKIQKKFGGEVNFWISGGAALDKSIWRDLNTLGFDIREGYGMTECAPIITFPRVENVKIGSPGQPLPGIEIKLENDEIAVRGGNVTQGYYKRPQETAESIRDGWLYTGDLGYLDKDGFLFVTGRRKEIIVLPNGKNLNPVEMEIQIKNFSPEIIEVGVLMHENILQAVVRVSPDFIVKNGSLEDAKETMRNSAILPYNRATATYKRIIKFVLTTEEFQRTRVGKLRRFSLIDFIKDDAINAPKIKLDPEPTSQIYKKLRTIIATQISLQVRPDAHMEMDLGLDSLGKIAVQCYVRENCGLEISERDFEKYPTLRQFSKMVEENSNPDFTVNSKDVTWNEIINSTPFPKIEKPHFLHFLCIGFFRLFEKLLYKTKVTGLENLKSDKPLIIAPNHQSYADGLYVMKGMTQKQINRTYFFAKLRNILKGGFLRKLADRSNFIIMDINENVSESLRKLAQALRENNNVIIFPEGTRTKDGKIAEFKSSFAILAKELNVPVVPVAIKGAYEGLKPKATLPDFGTKVQVTFLPQMTINPDETYEAFTSRVQSTIQENL